MRSVFVAVVVAVLGMGTQAGAKHKAAEAATAPVPPVLGVTVGAPLALPECPTDGRGGYNLLPVIEHDCWTHNSGDGDNGREIWLSSETEAHAEFARAPVYLEVDGGNVSEVVIRTTGVDSQTDALGALVAKFGRPTAHHIDALQNRMGAKFAGVRARWLRSNVVVEFDSTADDLDNGEIDVMTPEFARAQRATRTKPSL